MQVRSINDAATAQPPARATDALARLNHPAVAGVIALLGWLGFALARLNVWAAGHISLFIMSGENDYSHPAQMPSSILHVPLQGYDGQFYYRFALNPFNWHHTAYGITVDYNYRYTRLGFPLIAWIVSLGHHYLVPVVLVALNLVFVAIMGWLGGKFARESGRHALWGLLFVAYFGLVISVGRDTAEPLADACMLGGLLSYRHARYVLAALLVAYGVITNEPILVVPVAIALTRLYAIYRHQARPGRPDLVWALPGAAYVVLQIAERFITTGRAGGAVDVTRNFTLPFKALVPAVVSDFRLMSWTHLGMYDINLIEFIALAAVVVAGLLVLRSTTAPMHERIAFAGFVLVEMVIASGQFWDTVFGDGRTYIDAFLLAVIMLLATPSVRVPAPVTAVADGPKKAWIATADRVFAADRVVTNKRLGILATIAVAALIVVARRRILFQ